MRITFGKGIERMTTLERDNVTFDKGLPLNPYDFTGKLGKGNLPDYGPNWVATPVIVHEHEGRWYALCIREDEKIALPESNITRGQSLTDAMRSAIDVAIDESGKGLASLASQLLDGQVIFSGFVSDPRTTDNAWVEKLVVLLVVQPEIAREFPLREQAVWTLISPQTTNVMGRDGIWLNMSIDHVKKCSNATS